MEFLKQDDYIIPSTMPIYSLSSNIRDVELNSNLICNAENRIKKIFRNDTVGFRDDNPKLKIIQDANFFPLYAIIEENFGITVSVINDLYGGQNEPSVESLKKYYKSLSLDRMVCLEMLSSLLKSSALAILTLNDFLEVRKAIQYSRMEERFQTEDFGKIEEFHVFDEVSILLNGLAAKNIWDLNV